MDQQIQQIQHHLQDNSKSISDLEHLPITPFILHIISAIVGVPYNFLIYLQNRSECNICNHVYALTLLLNYYKIQTKLSYDRLSWYIQNWQNFQIWALFGFSSKCIFDQNIDPCIQYTIFYNIAQKQFDDEYMTNASFVQILNESNTKIDLKTFNLIESTIAKIMDYRLHVSNTDYQNTIVNLTQISKISISH